MDSSPTGLYYRTEVLHHFYSPVYYAQYRHHALFTVNNQNAIGLPVGTASVERAVSLLCKMHSVLNVHSDMTAKLNSHDIVSVFADD